MQFLITLLSVSLVMSCIMLSLFLLSSFTIRKTSAKTRYMMWIVLLIGLIIPFRPILGKGLITLNSPSVNPPIEERIQAEIVVEETARPELSADNSASEFSLAETSAQQEEVSASSSSANSTSRSFFDAFFSIYTLILIWAIGAIAVFSRYMLQYQNFRRMIRRWGEKVREAETLLLFEEVKAYMGLGNKRIDLAVCPFITTPMLTGIFKPVVLLPQRVFSEDELELIFEHELTHYKHKDLLVNFLTVVTLAVHWFNPLLYIFVPSVYNDGESYCDETVLFGKDNNYRRFYGEVIISMIDTNVKRPIALSTCFYTKKINLKRRLFHIMESSKRKKQYSMVGIALALGLTLASGSVFVFASPSRNDIGLQKAKMIALKNAGLYAANVSFVNARLDKDGATRVYEIEFFSNGMEYDYTIDAISGAILNKDSDIDNFSIPQNNKTSQGSAPVNTSGISLEKAKEIALKNAGLNSSNVSFVKAKLDSDDGRKVYDIEFYSNNVEYDYEIDATSGAILDKDTDIESFSTSQNNEVVQGSNSSNISGVAQPIRSSDTSGVAQTSASSNNSGTAQTSASSNTSGVSLDKSKPVSVNQAGLTGSQVQTTKSTSGNEGGRSNYNIDRGIVTQLDVVVGSSAFSTGC
ncbi:MAG: M56 family metallopeptidase [Filifactor alocis]|nr:M56 family metallopeptidase [Filifactor alocis]